MADSKETNETGAAAAEPANGDQQVRSNVTQNDTHYKTKAYYELIWSLEFHVDKLLWGINHHPQQTPENRYSFTQSGLYFTFFFLFFLHLLNVVIFVFTQNVVSRVSNLTLVSSACEVVSSAYTSTKESMPMLKGVMDAAESGVRTLGAAATTGSKPLLDIMEPQRRFFPLCKIWCDIRMCDNDAQIHKMEMYYKRISFNVETDARSTLYQILTYDLILEMRIIQVYSCKKRFFFSVYWRCHCNL